ncbi:MAG: metalloregulator ArsR/SmtB family transcription factor [Candidatus Nomurabacteria bacterium]|nr:metalloregulator ArsR/SmtB family transcription factor [Candidatus Nomurabacteria bacterium]
MKIPQLEKILKALAYEKRLEIMQTLSQHKFASVGYIADKINLSIHATSKHLAILEHAKAVIGYREGNYIMYKLRPKMHGLIRSIIGRIS